MDLSTGKVTPKVGKYGIENLRAICRSVVNIVKVIEHLKANPAPQKFWAKVWYWVKGLFANKDVFAQIGADLVQLAANADAIKDELRDLDGEELQQLFGLLLATGEVQFPERLVATLPKLLDTIQALAACLYDEGRIAKGIS